MCELQFPDQTIKRTCRSRHTGFSYADIPRSWQPNSTLTRLLRIRPREPADGKWRLPSKDCRDGCMLIYRLNGHIIALHQLGTNQPLKGRYPLRPTRASVSQRLLYCSPTPKARRGGLK